MSSAPSLDPSVLARIRARHSDRYLAQVIDLFLREAPPRIDIAWREGPSGDARKIAVAAHAVGCLAGNVGAIWVRGLAADAEKAAAGGREGAARLPAILFDLEIAFAEARSCLLDARGRISA